MSVLAGVGEVVWYLACAQNWVLAPVPGTIGGQRAINWALQGVFGETLIVELAAGASLRHAWGKRVRGPVEMAPPDAMEHPLAHHLMDVAAVLLRLLECGVFQERVETAAGRPLSEVDRQRLAALAFLHDVGKLHPGFQAKGWPESMWGRPTRGHTSESVAFLDLALRSREHPFHEAACELESWGDAFAPLALAMFSHHGRPLQVAAAGSFADWDRPALKHYRWREEAIVLASLWRKWFPRAFEGSAEPLPTSARFHHLIAGLAALADWIGSDTRVFEYVPALRQDYDRVALERATRAISATGLDGMRVDDVPPTFSDLAGFDSPLPAQAAVGNVDPDARLVILEAETGSGKTEAALWRFTHLLSAGKVAGLYFAVPTRSAATQIHGRVQAAVRGAYGATAPEVVLAIPGTLRAGDHRGNRLPDWNVRWDDEKSSPHRWAAEHATRFLAARVAVGTVDQAMLAGLMVKHAHLRGSAMSRSLLVIDELHASDSYMANVLTGLLRDHVAVGGYAMLMSATLGARARVQWLETEAPDIETATSTPYPAVWVKGETTPRVPGASGRGKCIGVEEIPSMEPECAADLAIRAARDGARVLVVRNTVRVAVRTWEAVAAHAPELLLQVRGGPALHHGRFAAEDRLLLDEAVESALKPRSGRGGPGCIVIGTQTLEQSLDIDADLLVTDLCPMDVLLQRIGRLHRHETPKEAPRPEAFASPRTMVMVPAGGVDPLVEGRFENGLGAWTSRGQRHAIYGDLAVLELTRRLMARSPWSIPKMNRELVEGATHPDCIEALLEEKGERWRRYDSDERGQDVAQGLMGRSVALDRGSEYLAATFPGTEEKIMTRLGEDGVVLDFAPIPGPFGTAVSRIALPGHWSRGLTGDDEVDVRPEGDALEFHVADRRFWYTRAGLGQAAGNGA